MNLPYYEIISNVKNEFIILQIYYNFRGLYYQHLTMKLAIS